MPRYSRPSLPIRPPSLMPRPIPVLDYNPQPFMPIISGYGMPLPEKLSFSECVPSFHPDANEFYKKVLLIYAAITEINPTYKQTVGSCIIEFVAKLVG